MTLAFRVHGLSQPKGSTRSFRHAKTGKVITLADNPKGTHWEQLIQYAAGQAVNTQGWLLTHGAVHVTLLFVLPRPKSVSRKTRPHHTVKPDCSKLVRCAEDALTGVVWHDDAQVVSQLNEKRYAEPGESAYVDVQVEVVEEFSCSL